MYNNEAEPEDHGARPDDKKEDYMYNNEAQQDEEKEEQKKPPPKLSELFETKTKDLKQMTVKLKTNGLSNRLNQALKASASQADLLGPRYASGWTYVYELVWLTLLRHVCASAFARRYASLLSVSG